MTYVDHSRLREEVEWWLSRRGRVSSAPVLELAGLAGVSVRRVGAVRAGETCSIDTAEKLLFAMDVFEGPRRSPTTGRLVRYPIRWSAGPSRKVRGDQVGRLKNIDFANALLTYAQLKQIHRAHWEQGLSLRDLCRLHWKRWGYVSEKSALSSLSDRLREAELPVRTRAEATALANAKRRTRGEHETKAQYKARKRREAREADPAVAEAQRRRLEWLREKHARAEAAA